MAGSFGYEAEHVAVSKAMAEMTLLPAIRNAPQAAVLADGTSCRHQIADGTRATGRRQAVHAIQVLQRALATRTAARVEQPSRVDAVGARAT